MPTRIYQSGFEMQTATEWAENNNTGSTSNNFSSTKAYSGTYSLRHSSGSRGAGITFSALSQLRAAAFFNHDGGANSAARCILGHVVISGGDEHWVEWDITSNALVMYVDSVQVASVDASAVGFSTTNTWYRVGVTYKSGASGYFSLYLNGVKILTYTGNTGADATAFYWGGRKGATGWGTYLYVDDFYIDSTSGESDSAPPEVRFLYSAVTGAGSLAQFSLVGAASNHLAVDDTTPNGDTDYVYATASGLKDRYATGDITLPPGYTLKAAIPVALAKVTGTGPTLKVSTYDGSSEAVSAAQTPGSDYAPVWGRLTTQAGGGAWDQSAFNAAQFGIESAGTY